MFVQWTQNRHGAWRAGAQSRQLRKARLANVVMDRLTHGGCKETLQTVLRKRIGFIPPALPCMSLG
jgi:hypothetical protein